MIDPAWVFVAASCSALSFLIASIARRRWADGARTLPRIYLAVIYLSLLYWPRDDVTRIFSVRVGLLFLFSEEVVYMFGSALIWLAKTPRATKLREHTKHLVARIKGKDNVA